MLNGKQIAIVGGGPGGLTLARLLQQKGFTVKVYERDRDRNVRVQGATLDLHEESGLKALDAAGLMPAFEAAYRPGADRMRIVDKNGKILLDEHTHDTTERGRPEIDRGPLRELLLNSLEPGTVVWDCCFESLRALETGWELQFSNGMCVRTDVVIAADGASSRLRPYVRTDKPFYTDITILEGTVYHAAEALPEIHRLLSNGKLFVMEDEKTLILSSKGDGSLQFYTGCKLPESWTKDSGIDFADREQLLAWFRDQFAGWGPFWGMLFEKASLPLTPRPQYCMPTEPERKQSSGITLLGDAAHLMPPYAGEGVNMAMLDALELSECLSDPACNDADAAIAAYEQKMQERISGVARLTLEQTAMLHSPQALSSMFRVLGLDE